MIITTFKSEFSRIAGILGIPFTTKEIQEEQEYAQEHDFSASSWINWKPLKRYDTDIPIGGGVMFYEGQCELLFLTKANTYDDEENNKDLLIDQMAGVAEDFFRELNKNAALAFSTPQEFSMSHEVLRNYTSNYLVGVKATIRFKTACNTAGFID